MFRPKFLLAALLCGTLFVGQAAAADIKFGFAGEVVGYLPASPATISAFPLGTPVVGQYSFNSLSIDFDPSSQIGEYTAAVTALEASIGGGPSVTLAFGGLREIFVYNNSFLGGDGYSVLADVIGMPAPGIVANRISINLLPGNTSAFSSDALPLTPPSLGDFPTTFDSQFILQSSSESVIFNIASLTLVPEPASLMLLCSGMLALATIRRR